jgi:putative flippase GtrA
MLCYAVINSTSKLCGSLQKPPGAPVSARGKMIKPIIVGVLGLLVGYGIYLLIFLLFLPADNPTLGVLIALITGVIFFFVGSRYFSKKVAK